MSESAQLGGRYALIVAVSNYNEPKLPKLQAPAADAERLKAVLSDPDIGGFHVDVALDEEESKLRRRIAKFFANRRPEDLLLVHFSCHGVTDASNRLYLAAKDTELDVLEATGIASEWLNDQMTKSMSKRIVMLLDCCFSGLFPSGTSARSGEDVNALARFQGGGIGRAVITATNELQRSYEGKQLRGEVRPSFFTEAVVEGLETGKADRNHDNWISIDELYAYVFDRVREKTPHQTPKMMQGVFEGAVYIAKTAPPKRRAAFPELKALEYAAGLRPVLELPGNGSEIFSLAFAPSSKLLVAGSDGAVLVWAAETEVGQWGLSPPGVKVIPVDDTYIYSVTINSTGDLLAASGEDGIIRMYELPSLELKWQNGRGHTEAVYSVDFDPEGTTLASGGYDRRVNVWDANGGQIRRQLAFSGRISSVAFSPNADESLLAIGSLDNTVALWESRAGELVRLGEHRSSVEALAFAPPDGAMLASVGLDKAVAVWDMHDRAPLWRKDTVHEYLVRAVAFAPGGLTIASASWDKTVRLWDAHTGEAVEMPQHDGWPKHTDWIWSVRFTHDGSALATAGSDDKVIIWVCEAVPD